MIWLLLLSLANAQVPADVRPAVSPLDTEAQVNAWRKTRGLAEVQLACDTLWAGAAVLCFRHSGDMRAYVTHTEMASWGVDLAGLRAQVAARSAALVVPQLTQVQVSGMRASYYLPSGEHGWGSAWALHPNQVQSLVGAPLLVGAPASGISMAWLGGRRDVDKVMAVGVREIYTTRQGSISPVVYRWNVTEWVAHTEAVPSQDKSTAEHPK